jgi:hypothetical protein
MSVNRLKSTRIFGELIVEDLSGNTNANTVLNRNLSVTGNITTPKIVSPFNSFVNLSFLNSFPTTAAADSNAGVGFFWNQSGGQGETDLILYGQGGPGGLALFGANNLTAPTLISKLYPSLIEFATTPTFPTSNTIGAIAATTSYVNNVLNSYLTTANAASTYLSQSSASSIYLTTANAASTYLSQSSASSIYLTITNAASTYLTGTTAALTYQPITLMGNYLTTITATATYLTQSSAASIYQTISNMSNYITQGGNIPLNNNAKLSFPSSYPGTTPVNNNNAGIGFYWNDSNQYGETDLLCYGKDKMGGLTISTASNTGQPLRLCTFYRDFIGFTFAPQFATNINVGNIAATTSYVDDRLLPYNILNNFTFTPIGSNILYA